MHRFVLLALLGVLLSVTAPPPAAAWEPDEVLADPALENRARALDTQIRCVVCENQSIAESEVSRARDLRLLVRERLVAGDSDAEAVEYLRDRYGDGVLMSTPFNRYTAMVWLAPVGLLIFGVLGFYVLRRKVPAKAPAASAPLTPEEQARLAALTPRVLTTRETPPDA